MLRIRRGSHWPAKKSKSVSPGDECTLTMRLRTPSGFCVGYPVFFTTIRADDSMPPDICRCFTARSLLFADQAGCHVRDPIHLVKVESVVLRGFGVP